jgi:hypothetical protein
MSSSPIILYTSSRLTSSKVSNVLNVYAGLQNILNEDYRTPGSGINGVGRSAWLSAAIKM